MDAILKFLVESWLKSLQIRSRNGSVPLHYALDGNLSMPALQLQLEAWPKGAHVQNNDWCLPLHHACQHAYGDEVITIV